MRIFALIANKRHLVLGFLLLVLPCSWLRCGRRSGRKGNAAFERGCDEYAGKVLAVLAELSAASVGILEEVEVVTSRYRIALSTAYSIVPNTSLFWRASLLPDISWGILFVVILLAGGDLRARFYMFCSEKMDFILVARKFEHT